MQLSALILAKNEEDMIEGCLSQLSFADEIIVCDQNSSDKTVEIAKKYTNKILSSNFWQFDKNRNLLLSQAKGKWVLYVDCDERLTPQLIHEIKKVINNQEFSTYLGPQSKSSRTRTAECSAYLGPQSESSRTRTAECSAFYIPRKNFILGKHVRHGGWWPDFAPRLFKKVNLINWTGHVHESPQINGKFGYLDEPLIHLSGRSLNLMLAKSIKWAKIEADLFYKAGSHKVTAPKVAKATLSEFLNRYIAKMGILDGTIGLIEAIYQGLHRAMVLTYLWEIQNNSAGKFKKAKEKQ